MSKKALGKGLQALLSTERFDEHTSTIKHKVVELPLDQIQPSSVQPRKSFDELQLQELAISIKEYGLIQPVVVTHKSKDSYELLIGERRFRACRSLGLKSIPAIIKEDLHHHAFELALIENIQREDLNAIEQAVGYHELLERLGLTHDQLSQRIGKSRAAITNTLRLLKLPHSIQSEVISKRLTEGHARALLGLKDSSLLEEVGQYLCSETLSVRQVEQLVQSINQKGRAYLNHSQNPTKPPLPNKTQHTQHPNPKNFEILEQHLQQTFKVKVKFKNRLNSEAGKLEIHYKNTSEFKTILEYFGIE